MYHNKPGRHNYEKPFSDNLTNHYKLLLETIESQDHRNRRYLVQCLENHMCFHKGLLTTIVRNYSKEVEQS